MPSTRVIEAYREVADCIPRVYRSDYPIRRYSSRIPPRTGSRCKSCWGRSARARNRTSTGTLYPRLESQSGLPRAAPGSRTAAERQGGPADLLGPLATVLADITPLPGEQAQYAKALGLIEVAARDAGIKAAITDEAMRTAAVARSNI